MSKEILIDYGWCQVIKELGKFYLRFDEGSVVIMMNTYEISEKKAELALKNEIEAEKMAVLIQKRNLK